jgi:glyoxylase-like metal-dependent hydrolase (beta-lactamase superfamily II)
MRILKKHDFGDVRGWELGWSPAGQPLMTTICYRAGSVLIDTGLAHMRSEVLDLVEQERNDIEAVLLTHYHEDHSGNAAALKTRFSLPVYGSAETARKLARPYRIFPYQHLMWGATKPLEVNPLPDVLEIGGLRLQSIPTPGHSRDHMVFLVPERGWLFSGDIYLSHHIKYFRADERIDDQIRSLEKVRGLDFDALFCGHHPQPEKGKDRIIQKLQYLEDFYGSVAALAEKGLNPTEVMKALGLKEVSMIKWICFGNVSMKNMVRSVMRSIKAAEADDTTASPQRGK